MKACASCGGGPCRWADQAERHPDAARTPPPFPGFQPGDLVTFAGRTMRVVDADPPPAKPSEDGYEVFTVILADEP